MQDVWTLFAIAVAGALVAGTGIAATAWLLIDGPFWRTLEAGRCSARRLGDDPGAPGDDQLATPAPTTP